MSSTILLVFQDCYDCGASKKWYEAISDKARKSNIKLQPLPHGTSFAKHIILKANEKGIGVPFLTDGKTFSRDIKAFLKSPEKRKKKEIKHDKPIQKAN